MGPPREKQASKCKSGNANCHRRRPAEADHCSAPHWMRAALASGAAARPTRATIERREEEMASHWSCVANELGRLWRKCPVRTSADWENSWPAPWGCLSKLSCPLSLSLFLSLGQRVIVAGICSASVQNRLLAAAAAAAQSSTGQDEEADWEQLAAEEHLEECEQKARALRAASRERAGLMLSRPDQKAPKMRPI